MKIVFIIDSLQRHGTQRALVHLVRGLGHYRYEQYIIALNRKSDPGIVQDLAAAGGKVIFIGKIAVLLLGTGWLQLTAILKKLKPDVVVTMLDFADTLGRPAARLGRCPTIVSAIRARNLAKPIWRRWLDRQTIQWAEKVTFNSEHVAAYAVEHEGVRANQAVVIPNGVEDLRARSASLRQVYRQRLSISPETTLIGAIGRLHRQKNFALLLSVASELRTTKPWKILVIGDGPENYRLRSISHALGLDDRVIWLGARDDVEACLAAMDLFVHTADFEGMPNAVMEAMAMGLPVVASAVDGNRELIRDGLTGYLITPGDADAFATHIVRLMNDPDLARQIGVAAHRDVLERFNIDRMVESYHRLLGSLAEKQSA